MSKFTDTLSAYMQGRELPMTHSELGHFGYRQATLGDVFYAGFTTSFDDGEEFGKLLAATLVSAPILLLTATTASMFSAMNFIATIPNVFSYSFKDEDFAPENAIQSFVLAVATLALAVCCVIAAVILPLLLLASLITRSCISVYEGGASFFSGSQNKHGKGLNFSDFHEEEVDEEEVVGHSY